MVPKRASLVDSAGRFVAPPLSLGTNHASPDFLPPDKGGPSMRLIVTLLSCAALVSLTACGGKGDDKLGDQAEQAADNRADALDAAAANSSGATEQALEAQADATREAGASREEAIDASDINAHALSNAQKEAVVNGQ
jgi:hypothetical protein